MVKDGHSSTEAHDGETNGPVILQVVPALESGGVERGTVEIAGAIAEAGGTALVASCGGRMVQRLERVGGRHIVLPVDRKNPVVIHRNAVRLANLIDAEGVDLVHARSRAPAWSAYSAARRTGCHFVTTVHGPYSCGGLKRWYNSSMIKGERVIAISDFIADYLAANYGIGPPRVSVIHRGISLETFDRTSVSAQRMVNLAGQWRIPDGVPLVLMPARLTRWKGQALFIKAVAELGMTDLRCMIVGDDQGRGAYRRELEALVRRHRLEPVVHIGGECRDMPAAYMLADVVVSASTEPEAFGRVIAEAQAMGRPVIATDHGAARETVLPGQTGWLTAPRDIGALVHALRAALSLDPDRRERMASAAIAHISANFSKEAMCQSTLALYNEVLSERAARPASVEA